MLGRKGQPVHISSIENYISDSYLDRLELPCEEKKHKRVAIVGSGPAASPSRCCYAALDCV